MPDFNLKHPKNRELLGGDLLAQALAHLGTSVAFGLHGGHLDAFLVGCSLAGIRLIDTRHETVAVQAAEGYAKVAGGVGVCFVTANSGFCNGFPGLATAFADRSPIFCVTSSPPLRDAETNCLQGFHDQVVLAKPVTKFAHRVTCVEEIPRITAYAFRTAHSGTPGPVLVDFPIDVLFSPPRMSGISWGALSVPAASPPGPDPHSVQQLLRLWKSAARPVIISGTGAARASEAGSTATSSPLLQLAEATSTPIFSSSKYSPSIPHSHPLRGGSASLLAILPYIQKPRPDLIILLGARTGFLLGGRGGAIIPKEDCQLVQVDLDGAEIGRLLPVHLGIASDASLFVNAMLDAVKDSPVAGRDEWLQVASSLKTLPSPTESEPVEAKDGLLHPYHAIKAVFAALPPSSILVIDGGEAGVWATGLAEQARPSNVLSATGYLGFLGNGWGYSLGVGVAQPDSLVVNIQGDGSAGFHIQELDTFARHGVNVLSIVVNNYFWGMSVAGQDIMYGDDEPVRPAVELSPKCRFEIVAQGFGCRAAKVDRLEEIEKTVKDLTAEKGPGLVNLIVSRQPVTSTTKAMVGKPPTNDPDVIVVPYYDNVPRPYYNEK